MRTNAINLCCTAEVGAMLLERAGDAEGGKVVRAALEAFQREYAKTHPSVRVIWLCARVWSGGGAGCRRVLSVERERGVESIRREKSVLL